MEVDRNRRQDTTDRQIHGTRYGTFPQGALTRGDAVDERREMIVQPPTETGDEDEQAGDQSSCCWPPCEQRRGAECRQDPKPASETEMIAEHQCAECGRGGQFQIQPQGDGGGLGEAQAEQQCKGTTDSAEEHGTQQPQSIALVGASWQGEAALAQGGGRHDQSSAEIEQSRQLEWCKTDQ